LLIATNNRLAQIVVGEERILITGASTSTFLAENGLSNTRVSFTTEQRDIGTTLKIIPYINDDDTVTMHIEQDNSTVLPKGNTILVSNSEGETTGVQVDAVDSARVLATVNAKNNLAVAVGGLIRNENTKSIQKVPWLGDIPYLGWFFRREVNSTEKTELVLLITPRIIRSGEEGQSIMRTRAAELSTHGWHSFGQAGTDIQNPQIEKYRKDVQEIQKKLKDDANKAE
jgi:type II secretory pathway component GspD/PulD (secretin)